MNISLQDVRLERESPSSYRVSTIYHIPTGLEIEFANALPKTEAIRRLQKSLNERAA